MQIKKIELEIELERQRASEEELKLRLDRTFFKRNKKEIAFWEAYGKGLHKALMEFRRG